MAAFPSKPLPADVFVEEHLGGVVVVLRVEGEGEPRRGRVGDVLVDGAQPRRDHPGDVRGPPLRRDDVPRLPLLLTTRGTGCALILRSSVRAARDEEIVYKRADGKALGVHVTWNQRRMLVLLTHLPHSDEERTQFYDEVRLDLENEYAQRGWTLGEREGLWMADHNNVVNPQRDSTSADAAPHHPQTNVARFALATAINAGVSAREARR